MKYCELCEVNEAKTEVEYHDVNYEVCEQCKVLAENE
ncbi:hypothetical protein MEZE111188_05710 [Mesobacillus zeae]